MQLNPYGEDAVLFAVDLIRRPPQTAVELTNRCVAAGLVLDHPAEDADLTATRRFLDCWLEVVDASDPAERAERLNTILERSSSYPRLTDHADGGWHVHYRPFGLRLADQIEALVSVGTALHLAGRGMHRLGRCAAAGCVTVYSDVSRTGRQRYCSPACANRDAVRRHRARRAAA